MQKNRIQVKVTESNIEAIEDHPVILALQSDEVVIATDYEPATPGSADFETALQLPAAQATADYEPTELLAVQGTSDAEAAPGILTAFINTTFQNQSEASTSGQQQLTQTNHNGKHTFEDIILKFLNDAKPAPQPNNKKRRICSGAEQITTKEYLDKVKEKEGKGPEVKKISKVTKCKKKLQEISSSSDEDVSSLQKSSSEEDCTSTVFPVINDFVIVLYNQQYYPGQVKNVTESNGTVKHMVRCGKFCWRWPEKQDILAYTNEDILKIIPQPILQNKRAMYNISVMKKCQEF
ncbi:hypothetical protein FQA39_LY00294 [Lamprigera yunnana]|nr:hypothetical protein FQA39_LY00294 [Lamprigera yunnana]